MDVESLNWEKMQGLIPAVVQDAHSGRVLMLAYMNRQAFTRTLQSGNVVFFSRTRQRLWMKGETSGHLLRLTSLRADCDGDALLVLADPTGPTCHRGTISCFGQDNESAALEVLGELDRLIQSRFRERPAGSYTTRLFEQGTAVIARKLGEEAIETVVSVMESPRRSLEEAADLLYHLCVLLASRKLSIRDAVQVLEERRGQGAPSQDDSPTP